MAPYKRLPRRHFTDQIFNPYFHSQHYQETHGHTEESIEKGFLKLVLFLKKIIGKK